MSMQASDGRHFTISLARDDRAGLWIATCEDIPLATEATTLDALVARVADIAPEIAVMNGVAACERDVRLRLVIEVTPDARQAS
jgi:hypothetical protein